ncbi:MAG: hypothetical protein HY707_13565 [Ignavibacteriae bacterium]|nr:hypothetical protein [Ignavibacteriota bacterium]
MNRRIEIFLLPLVVSLLTLLLSHCAKKPDEMDKELVTFYEVPLACGTAPDIGCGSRIKPLFVDTEQENNIKESWTNRQGTVLAIVWNENMIDADERMNILQPLFAKHRIEARYVSDTTKQHNLLASLREGKDKWLKGMDVDQLSIEEAGSIATAAVEYPKEAKLIDEHEAEVIQSDIEAYLREELVKVRTYEELEAAGEQWYAEMYTIYVKHIGKKRADKVRLMYEEYQSRETEND